jgi:hypothetical protein
MMGSMLSFWQRLRASPGVKSAMRKYRREHPRCEWDNCSAYCDVHHIIPVHVAPHLAADVNNMITLGARRCHLAVGHAGDWQRRWVPNVRTLCGTADIAKATKPENGSQA